MNGIRLWEIEQKTDYEDLKSRKTVDICCEAILLLKKRDQKGQVFIFPREEEEKGKNLIKPRGGA